EYRANMNGFRSKLVKFNHFNFTKRAQIMTVFTSIFQQEFAFYIRIYFNLFNITSFFQIFEYSANMNGFRSKLLKFNHFNFTKRAQIMTVFTSILKQEFAFYIRIYSNIFNITSFFQIFEY